MKRLLSTIGLAVLFWTSGYLMGSSEPTQIVEVPFPVLIEADKFAKPVYDDYDLRYTSEDMGCLIKNIFYEAPRYFRGKAKQYNMTDAQFQAEIERERIKIVNVTLNRVASDRYPDTICGVVMQNAQFSWTRFDDKVARSIEDRYEDNRIELNNLSAVKEVAKHALTVGYDDQTQGSLFYHTHDVNPKWNRDMIVVTSTQWHRYYND